MKKGNKPNINPKNKAMLKKAMAEILKENTMSVMNESVDFTTALFQICLSIILNDKYNWNKVDIQKIIKQIEELNRSITEKKTSIYDVIITYKDELGFEVPPIIENYMKENLISQAESI